MKWTMIVLAAMSLAGCGDKGDDTAADLTGDPVAGETVFSSTCAACHGADGSGGSGPSMTDEVPDQTEDEMKDIILNGYDAMPAQSLTDQEVADVIAYLDETFGPLKSE